MRNLAIKILSIFRKKFVGPHSFPKAAWDILESARDIKKWKNQIVHVRQFTDENHLNSYGNVIGKSVLSEVKFNEKAAKILDFGCWSGITTKYLSELTGCNVTGVDIDTRSIEFANKFIGSEQVKFLACSTNNITLDDNEFDLVVVNQVFCNMRREYYEKTIKDLSRVLKSAGKIILVDSNNPKNTGVQARLKQLYLKLEGPTDSNLNSRIAFIDKLLHNSRPNDKLARETCYKSKDEIVKYINLAPKNRVIACSLFDQESLKPPVMINSNGAPSSPTDPEYFIQEFSKYSINCKSGPGYPPSGKSRSEASFCIVGIKQ